MPFEPMGMMCWVMCVQDPEEASHWLGHNDYGGGGPGQGGM